MAIPVARKLWQPIAVSIPASFARHIDAAAKVSEVVPTVSQMDVFETLPITLPTSYASFSAPSTHSFLYEFLYHQGFNLSSSGSNSRILASSSFEV